MGAYIAWAGDSLMGSRIYGAIEERSISTAATLNRKSLVESRETSAIAGLEQRRCSVGAGPEFMGLNLLTVAAVLDSVAAGNVLWKTWVDEFEQHLDATSDVQ